MEEEKVETDARVVIFGAALRADGLGRWTAPAADEVKMDSEIGSYQADDEPRTGTIK